MLKRVLISSVAILATVFSANATGSSQTEGRLRQSFIDKDLITVIASQKYLEAAISQAVQPIRLYDLDGDGLDQNDIDAVVNFGKAQAAAMRMQQWMPYDLNLDGKITRKEVEIADRIQNSGRGNNGERSDNFARTDLNQDGVITWDELVNVPANVSANYVPNNRFRNFGAILAFDQNGDGKVTVEEATSIIKSAFAKFDQNGNGVIDGDEMLKAMQARSSDREVPF